MDLFKHLKKRKVRASTESTLTTSAQVPNSGLAFVDNSQGCSVAIAELSNLLDIAIEQFDFEGEPSEQVQLQLKRLNNEAAKYENSCLEESTPTKDWNCSRNDLQVVNVAFACAAAVYDQVNPSLPGFSFEEVGRITPGMAGTTKETTLHLVQQPKTISKPNPRFPLLVVAIRGTASTVDRVVNLNGDLKQFDIFDPNDPETFFPPVFAHAGFLNSAEALMPKVSAHIENVTAKCVNHVLFTGHSAGGAVASLLLAKYLSAAAYSESYSSTIFSSVSFGAPPVTSTNLHPYILGENKLFKSENTGLVLSIANEYDLVPRADGAYIRSLVDLYRSIYSLPPIQENNRIEDASNPRLPRFSFDLDYGVKEKNCKKWPLPKPVYWHIGKIILLKVNLTNRGEDSEEDDLLLNALEVEASDFAKLLFCNVVVHKRLSYKDRLEMLSG